MIRTFCIVSMALLFAGISSVYAQTVQIHNETSASANTGSNGAVEAHAQSTTIINGEVVQNIEEHDTAPDGGRAEASIRSTISDDAIGIEVDVSAKGESVSVDPITTPSLIDENNEVPVDDKDEYAADTSTRIKVQERLSLMFTEVFDTAPRIVLASLSDYVSSFFTLFSF